MPHNILRYENKKQNQRKVKLIHLLKCYALHLTEKLRSKHT